MGLFPVLDLREPLAQTIKGEAASEPDVEIVRRLGLAGHIFVWISAQELADPPTAERVKMLRETSCAVGPFTLENANQAREWLNAGARYALLAPAPSDVLSTLASSVKKIAAEEALPPERLLLLVQPTSTSGAAGDELVSALGSLAAKSGAGCRECERPRTVGAVGGVLLALGGAKGGAAAETALLKRLSPLATSDRLLIVVSGLGLSAPLPRLSELHYQGIGFAAPASLGPLPPNAVSLAPSPNSPPANAPVPLQPGSALVDAGHALASIIRSDRPDGLMATIVEEDGGSALGLVFSTADSICAALRSGRGVYWSRSRRSLWRKGDTSGSWQRLVRVAADCDSDAVRFTVMQHGQPPSFCHRGTLTCWGFPRGLRALQETLEARKASAPPGSYTKRLFDDSTLLRNKLVEEAQELAEAEVAEDVAAEAADLLYFALVRCVAAGVTLAQVEEQLDRRALKISRRPGNAKESRNAAAAEILAAVAAKKEAKAGANQSDGAVAQAGQMRQDKEAVGAASVKSTLAVLTVSAVAVGAVALARTYGA